MKYAKLTNTTQARRAYSGLRDGTGRPLVLDAGQTKPVHPSLARHPRIMEGVQNGELEMTTPTVKEKAPVPAPAPAPPAEPPKEPIAPPVEPPPEEPPADDSQDSDSELRELFLDAPGITEKNVDSVLDSFTTIQELADADEDALVEAGVSKSFAGRVLEWAIENL